MSIFSFVNGWFPKYPKIPEFTTVQEFCPLLGITKNNETLTRGGKYAIVMWLEGKDYTGLDKDRSRSLDKNRQTFFEKIPSNITVLSQTHRTKVNRRSRDNFTDTIPIARDITNKWNENFKTSFRTKHFLTFVTDPGNIADQLDMLFEKKGKNDEQEVSTRDLQDKVKDSIVSLSDYKPKVLRDDNLASYWGWLINGRKINLKLPPNRGLDEVISGTSLIWPKGERYQIYEGNTVKYSGWLSIQQPPDSSSNMLITDILKVKRELSIYQSFSRVEKNAALRIIDDKIKNAAVFKRAPEILLLELQAISERLQADEVSMVRHLFSVEVFGDSPEELEAAIRDVQSTIEGRRYAVKREKINQEALFWSRFPETHNYNPRQRLITSENAANFVTFATVGQGIDTCSWGAMPVTELKTQTGSEFSFTFHAEPGKNKIGNTLVIGGTGSGKTTTTSFLLSQCFKFPNFRVLAFDRLKGMEIFTRFHGGDYIDFLKRIDLNPLQLDDTGENRTFLSQWFQMLTGKTEEEDQDVISNAVMTAFTHMKKSERTLKDLAPAFGLSGKGNVRRALNKWLPGGGVNDIFFNGKKDALDFSKKLVVLDMTSILDAPEVLGPMAYYLFHKLFMQARDDGGYAVFVDELGKYLNNDLFAPKVHVLLEEIRKTDGVFIGAIQEAGTVLNHEIAAKIKNNIATFLLFPEPRAEKEHYMDELGLNETEFEWIRDSHPRELMIKRREGESVIVNVDLSPLGKYLNVFDSGSSSVLKLKQVQKENPANWKEVYLNS